MPGFTGWLVGPLREEARPVPLLPRRCRRIAVRVVTASSPSHGSAGDRCRPPKLPDFSLVVPNLCNDMHDCSVATGDAWLKAHVVPLLHSPALAGGVVFVVFDEGTSDRAAADASRRSRSARPCAAHSVFTRATNHYGLLRTIEDAWHLPQLGLSRDGDADRRDLEGIGVRAPARNPCRMLVSIARALEERDTARPRRPRRGARGAGRAAARLGSRAAPLAAHGRTAARHRQGQDRPEVLAKPGPLTPEERGDPAPPAGRREARHPAAPLPRRAPVRPLPPRALGRRRLPGGAERARDSRRGPGPRGRRHLRRDDLGAALPPRADPRGGARRGRALRRHQFDPVVAELFVEVWAEGWDTWLARAS